MGTGIVAVLMNSLPFESPVLYYLSIVFFLLNVLIFVLAFTTSALRYILYPEIWKVMVQDPTNSLFLGTIPMGFATLIEMWILICVPMWEDWAASFAWAMWMVDVVAAASVTLSLSFMLLVDKLLPRNCSKSDRDKASLSVISYLLIRSQHRISCPLPPRSWQLELVQRSQIFFPTSNTHWGL